MKKLTFIFSLLLALTTVSCGSANRTGILASGQVEALQIDVAPELSGRAVEVLVEEGDSVNAGDPILRLDDSLLQSQKQAAQATLDSANASVRAAQATRDSALAQYDMTLSAALAQEQPQRQEAWKQSRPSEFDQPVWYFTKEEQIESAQAEVDAAKKALGEAQAKLSESEKKAGGAAFLEVEDYLSDARAAFDVAKAVLDNTDGDSDGTRLHDVAQTALDNAKTHLQSVQKDYNDALTTDGAEEIMKTRAEVEVASERYYTALDVLRAMQTGENSLSVVAAGKGVDQAEAYLEQAQFAEIAARANLDLINKQIEKYTVRAPIDGVVLIRSIQAGEVIQAGMPALTIGKLDSLKVTVYIPETQYGQIHLGQQATLSIDSFPDEVFTATVTRISDKAEFTPQNVQTKEGRQTTVYAVELSVENADGKFKPGMPVDVTFGNIASGK
jgi:HlyD family secretion protein